VIFGDFGLGLRLCFDIYQVATRVTRRMSLMEEKLLIVLERLGSPPVFSGVL